MTAAFAPLGSNRRVVRVPTTRNRARQSPLLLYVRHTSTAPLYSATAGSSSTLLAGSANDIDSVLSNTDIVVGIVLALLLAALASFLQSQRSQNDFVLGPLAEEENGDPIFPQAGRGDENSVTSISSVAVNTTATTTTFDDWKDMSQPDNYVWYNTRLRQSNKEQKEPSFVKQEQRWVLIALIVLFAPIFSFEFFLTVSRQLVCIFSKDLCLPYTT